MEKPPLGSPPQPPSFCVFPLEFGFCFSCWEVFREESALIAEGCSGGKNCCCRALGYSMGALGLCCPWAAVNSPGVISSSWDIEWPRVFMGIEIYLELLGKTCCCFSHHLAPECKFSNRLMTMGGVWGSYFLCRKAMFSPRTKAICLCLQVSLWLQLINHKYMLELCQACSDQRSTQSKDTHMERI